MNGGMDAEKSFMKNQSDSPVMLIIGTRPEGIKMAPVYHALKRAGVPTLLCSTMQHDQLLHEVFEVFDLEPDITLNIMRPRQDLFYITQAVLQKTKEIFIKYKPRLVLVQGDTTTAMAAALSAFYLRIPIGHVEAGLRTDDVNAPFPEEMNRRIIGMIASYHFAPTPGNVANLLANGLRRDQVFCTGNTVVDALQIVKEKIRNRTLSIRDDIQSYVQECKKDGKLIVLLTVHRRESFGSNLLSILKTVKNWAKKHPDVRWVYPFHPNPNVIDAIQSVGLSELETIFLCEPLAYSELIYVLDAAAFVVTDSGGIQEEAMSLAKPVLVLREKTERMEGVLLGCAKLVGFDSHTIQAGFDWAIEQKKQLKREIAYMYGDGHAAEKIVAFIQSCYEELAPSKNNDVEMIEDAYEPERELSVKKVCVIGLGYIGLPTAIVAAEAGYEVAGFDIDVARVHAINNGNPIIQEPETFEKLQIVLGAGSFSASTEIASADIFVIAVPTPITSDKKADLSYVFSACDSIATVLKSADLVLVESTIPVGTTKIIASRLFEKTGLDPYKDFFIAHCPERVLPGNIFQELVANDRIIGGLTHDAAQKAKEFYALFVSGASYLTNHEIAEMVKLVENSSRDVQLAFAHEIASMAQTKGINPYELIALANKHPRVSILQPSCGVGGHCIAVDPWFLVESFPEQAHLIKTARLVNDAKPYEVLQRIKEVVKNWQNRNDTKTCTVLLCGVTYKPNVEDLRESPALLIVQELLNDNHLQIMVTDPHVETKKMHDLFEDHVAGVECISQADVVVFLVAHDRFKLIDKKILASKEIVDACGVLQHISLHEDNSFWPARTVMDFFITNQPNEGNLQ